MGFWKSNDEKRIIRLVKEMLAIVKTADRCVEILESIEKEDDHQTFREWSGKLHSVAHMAHDVAGQFEIEEIAKHHISGELNEMEHALKNMSVAMGSFKDHPEGSIKKLEEDADAYQRVLAASKENLNIREKVDLRFQRILKQLTFIYEQANIVLQGVNNYQKAKIDSHLMNEIKDLMHALALLVHLFKDIFEEVNHEAQVDKHLEDDINRMGQVLEKMLAMLKMFEPMLQAKSHGSGVFYPKVYHEIHNITMELKQIEGEAKKELSN